MNDDLEMLLREQEASIEDRDFSAAVGRKIGHRSRLRSGVLFAAGGAGLALAFEGLRGAGPTIASFAKDISALDIVLQIPGVDMSMPVQGALLLAVGFALGGAMTLAVVNAAQD